MTNHPNTIISGTLFLLTLLIFVLMKACQPRNSNIGQGLLAYIIGFLLAGLFIIAGTILSICAIIYEQTSWSWLCGAAFLSLITTIVATMVRAKRPRKSTPAHIQRGRPAKPIRIAPAKRTATHHHLFAFQAKNKFSKQCWQERGLTPRSKKLSAQLNNHFNHTVNSIIQSLNNTNSPAPLIHILLQNLDDIGHLNLTPDERTLVSDYTEQLTTILVFPADIVLDTWRSRPADK